MPFGAQFHHLLNNKFQQVTLRSTPDRTLLIVILLNVWNSLTNCNVHFPKLAQHIF